MKKIAVSLLALSLFTVPALADDTIRIVGSSTVYPFTTTVAERFAKTTGVPTPIVESTGTGGGIKLFCTGEGVESIDAVNASRPMKKEEVELCKKNGVDGITELEIGIDAIVIAFSKEDSAVSFTTEQLYKALAKNVLVDGKFVPNTTQKWSDIDSSLPDLKIEMLGPPPTSGTRDSFVELVLEKECKKAIEKAALTVSKDEEKSMCTTIRDDGAFIEAGENDNMIVQKLAANPNAFGIFGFSFLEENTNIIQAVSIDGSEPDYDNVSSGKYPISRKLYVYFKNDHLESEPNLKKFMEAYKSDEAIGEDGYLTEKGLVALPK